MLCGFRIQTGRVAGIAAANDAAAAAAAKAHLATVGTAKSCEQRR